MALLIGTDDGVFRVPDTTLDDAEQVLDGGTVLRVRTFAAAEGVFTATRTGLYRSRDDGLTWDRLGVPREEVYSVVASSDGGCLYAGTHPAYLYVSGDRGETWDELVGFQDLPSREEWYTPRHRNEAHVRSLGVHPEVPERVIAGVEVGGVHVSEDRGETWTERRNGVHDDVHHVLVLGAGEYVASCGGGLYRTDDGGRSWTRLDANVDHTYFREAIASDGRLYAAAARRSPGTWRGDTGADGVLLESDDRGDTFEQMSYPGSPNEVVLAWTEVAGRVLAGTNAGRVLVRGDDGWTDTGGVSTTIRSMAVA